MSNEMEAIVLDNGSGVLKAGLSGEDTPRAVLPACAGKVKNPEWFASQAPTALLKADLRGGERESFVGAECQQFRDYLDVVHPIARGVVEDWDALERIWEYVFTHELRVSPENTTLPILCTSSPAGSKQQQEKMAQILFESQKACGFYFMQQCVLSLFASGRTRGIVVEVGHGSSHAIPIFEGYALPHAALHYHVGGMDVSHRLHKLLTKRGHSFHSFQSQTIDEIKEATCFMGSKHDRAAVPSSHGSSHSQSNNSAVADDGSKPFELPDGTILQVDRQTRMLPGDILYRPQDLGDEHPLMLTKQSTTKGLHEYVAESIAMCDKDLQKDLCAAVVLAGGTTMLPGFSKRFQEEIQMTKSLGAATRTMGIVPDPYVRERGYNAQRKIAAWVGGSMFASLSTFRDIHITKQEWEEYHEAILDRKCFG
uniref:Actin n=1 Tax=Globisporangium ultimum (strain ATCC 200006 / CBS 805.95 / DAOM BR144) TaxID=431595 RepID=K3WHZ1_GLOUD